MHTELAPQLQPPPHHSCEQKHVTTAAIVFNIVTCSRSAAVTFGRASHRHLIAAFARQTKHELHTILFVLCIHYGHTAKGMRLHRSLNRFFLWWRSVNAINAQHQSSVQRCSWANPWSRVIYDKCMYEYIIRNACRQNTQHKCSRFARSQMRTC